jgi:hypothetical protein
VGEYLSANKTQLGHYAARQKQAANRRQNMINTVQGFTARGVYLSAAEILLLMQQAKDLLSNG